MFICNFKWHIAFGGLRRETHYVLTFYWNQTDKNERIYPSPLQRSAVSLCRLFLFPATVREPQVLCQDKWLSSGRTDDDDRLVMELTRFGG